MTDRMEVQRTIAAPAADIFAVLTDPHGHVAIDASGMLQDATGEPARQVGDRGQRGGGRQRVEHHLLAPLEGHHRAHLGHGALGGVEQSRGRGDAGVVEDPQHARDLAHLHRAPVPGLRHHLVALLPGRVGHRGEAQPVPGAAARLEEVAVEV